MSHLANGHLRDAIEVSGSLKVNDLDLGNSKWKLGTLVVGYSAELQDWIIRVHFNATGLSHFKWKVLTITSL